VLPLSADGVPTHTSDRSLSSMPSDAEIDARSAPEETTRSAISSRPGSMTVGRPELTVATLPGSVSTPTTR